MSLPTNRAAGGVVQSADINAIAAAVNSKAAASHTHTAADLSGVVKTVNGTSPDGAGNVVVAGGGGSAAIRNFTPNRWGSPGVLLGAYGAESTVAGTLYGNPFIVTTPGVVNGAAISVTTAATTGATARIGIYSSISPGGDGAALVLDAGDVPIDSTGVKSVTGLTQSLAPGWYVAAVMVSADAALGVRTFTPPFGFESASSTSGAFATNGRGHPTHLGASVTYGAMPQSPTVTPVGSWTHSFARVVVQIGAA